MPKLKTVNISYWIFLLNPNLRVNEKMSIAATAQKLLRIVFRTYMPFPSFQIQKSVFSGAGVSPGFLGNGTKYSNKGTECS